MAIGCATSTNNPARLHDFTILLNLPTEILWRWQKVEAHVNRLSLQSAAPASNILMTGSWNASCTTQLTPKQLPDTCSKDTPTSCRLRFDAASIGVEKASWKCHRAVLTTSKSDESIVADVSKRDGFKCRITGFKASFMDPLVVTPIFPVIRLHGVSCIPKPLLFSQTSFTYQPEPLHELFGVFLGSDMQERLLNCTSSCDDVQNHWLIHQSAAEAVSQGYFRSTPTKGSNYRITQVTIGGPNRPPLLDRIPKIQWCSFTDHSNSGIETPDISLLLTTSRFSRSIRRALVAREIASRHNLPATSMLFFSPWHHFSEYVALTIASMCRLMPVSLRIRIYHSLSSLGSRLYGSSCSMRIQQFPFGMYLKTKSIEDHQALNNEFGALQLVRKQTQVPVPHPLDLVSDTDTSLFTEDHHVGTALGLVY
ncbi:hypothetical protein DER46DRAFT_662327 [Fusarium sp. MPI-SDFR-AT-0072]|nr:hypothetical protein DER46DRAFT_662327 [Fusarium sp. MPI-SDFR-AT-0072]